MPPIFLLADSSLLFTREPFRDVPASNSGNKATWWQSVVGSAVRSAISDGRKPIGCYLGASNGDQPTYFTMFEAAVGMLQLNSVKCVHVTAEASSADARCIAEDAALVLLAGGDPFLGWRAFQRSGVAEAVKRAHASGAVLVGISAGAIHLSAHGYKEEDGACTFPTLNLVPYVFGVHEEANQWQVAYAALRAIASGSPSTHCPVGIGIPYGAGLTVHEDGSLSPVGKDVPLLRPQQHGGADRDEPPTRPGHVRAELGVLRRAPHARYTISTALDGLAMARPWLPDIPGTLSQLPDIPGTLSQRILALRREWEVISSDSVAPGAAGPGGALSYRGPNKYANWLLPNRVCVGCFPCREVWRRDGLHAHREVGLASLLAAGVTLFVCLDASDDLVEAAGAKGLRPRYVHELPTTWGGEALVFGAEDGHEFAWETLTKCLEAIATHLQRQEHGACYIHCFGGHGRAGVVAACILGLATGMPASEALRQTQSRHDEREDTAWPLPTPQASPQTEVQRVQVETLLAFAQGKEPIPSSAGPSAASCNDEQVDLQCLAL